VDRPLFPLEGSELLFIDGLGGDTCCVLKEDGPLFCLASEGSDGALVVSVQGGDLSSDVLRLLCSEGDGEEVPLFKKEVGGGGGFSCELNEDIVLLLRLAGEGVGLLLLLLEGI